MSYLLPFLLGPARGFATGLYFLILAALIHAAIPTPSFADEPTDGPTDGPTVVTPSAVEPSAHSLYGPKLCAYVMSPPNIFDLDRYRASRLRTYEAAGFRPEPRSGPTLLLTFRGPQQSSTSPLDTAATTQATLTDGAAYPIKNSIDTQILEIRSILFNSSSRAGEVGAALEALKEILKKLAATQFLMEVSTPLITQVSADESAQNLAPRIDHPLVAGLISIHSRLVNLSSPGDLIDYNSNRARALEATLNQLIADLNLAPSSFNREYFTTEAHSIGHQAAEILIQYLTWLSDNSIEFHREFHGGLSGWQT